MNGKAINFIKNFSYTLTSNLISLIVSTLVVLVIPKLIGIEEYGYWQLYLFYSSYAGFLHFGWSDGIYLRYGGKKYKELNKRMFFSQFFMMVILQTSIAVLLFCISIFLLKNQNKIFILQMVAINLLIVNTLSVLLLTLQATNKIKEYAKITMISRIIYILLVVIFLLTGFRAYRLMIISDLIGKLMSLIYAMYCCRDIVFRKISTFYFSFREAFENIKVGANLMFANIASMLIIGVVRFGIERTWDVSTFGKVSLTLSVSNLIMLFINSVGIIIFPILRRTEREKLPVIYVTMRDFLMIVLLGTLIIYFPLRNILSYWLPKYADSLVYMALLFPISVYEGKMSLLINTYLKTLRKEKLMLNINLITLALSIIFTISATIVFKNLNFAIMSIVILLIFRCFLAEMFLSKILKISVYKDMLLELVMIIIFILSGWLINSWFSILIYLMSYVMYLIIKRMDITDTVKNLKSLMNS